MFHFIEAKIWFWHFVMEIERAHNFPSAVKQNSKFWSKLSEINIVAHYLGIIKIKIFVFNSFSFKIHCFGF